MPKMCPECGVAGVPLVIGFPPDDERRAAEQGRIALYGCLVPPDPPNWQCPHGHEWRDADFDLWRDEYERAMAATRAGG